MALAQGLDVTVRRNRRSKPQARPTTLPYHRWHSTPPRRFVNQCEYEENNFNYAETETSELRNRRVFEIIIKGKKTELMEKKKGGGRGSGAGMVGK